MPKEPPNFDCLDARQVLRLRFRDWMWPTAAAIAVAIHLLPRQDGPYPIGSWTFYLNVYGPPGSLAVILFAGLRWCWIGRIRRRDANRCGRCDYPLEGLQPSRDPPRCPECGTVAANLPTRRRIPLRDIPPIRLLLDLPGVLVACFPLFVGGLVLLVLFGVIVLD